MERPIGSAGIFRRMVIEVDGEPVARVRDGKTVEIPVEPGQHFVRARMDWHSSPDFPLDIQPEETVRLRVFHPIPWVGQWFRRTDSVMWFERV